MANRFLTQADKWRFGVIALWLVPFFIFQPMTSISVDWTSFGPFYLALGVISLAALTYSTVRRVEPIGATCLATAQLLVFCFFIVLDNYLALELRRPLIDEFLAGLDHALGIDWMAYVVWLKSDRFFGKLAEYAYLSSLPQIAAAIPLLGFTRRFSALDRLTLGVMIAATITVAAWIAFPNFGALPLHYAKGLPDPGFDLAMSKDYALSLLALHAGPLPPIRFGEVMGLIGCPSFHTVLALLTIHALWSVPWAGPIAAGLNALVLVAIPADGGHHFVDVAAGAVVAFLSIALGGVVLRGRGAKAPAAAAALSEPSSASPPARAA